MEERRKGKTWRRKVLGTQYCTLPGGWRKPFPRECVRGIFPTRQTASQAKYTRVGPYVEESKFFAASPLLKNKIQPSTFGDPPGFIK